MQERFRQGKPKMFWMTIREENYKQLTRRIGARAERKTWWTLRSLLRVCYLCGLCVFVWSLSVSLSVSDLLRNHHHVRQKNHHHVSGHHVSISCVSGCAGQELAHCQSSVIVLWCFLLRFLFLCFGSGQCRDSCLCDTILRTVETYSRCVKNVACPNMRV